MITRTQAETAEVEGRPLAIPSPHNSRDLELGLDVPRIDEADPEEFLDAVLTSYELQGLELPTAVEVVDDDDDDDDEADDE